MKFRSFVPTAMAVALLALSGCASGSETAAGDSGTAEVSFVKKDPLKIGYSVMDLQDPYFQSYVAGIKAEAGKLGAQVIVADQKSSQQEQVSGSASLISQGISALIVSPVQPSALPATINAAHSAQIPVVIGDVGAEGNYDAYILSDNQDGGKQAADYFRKAFEGKSGKHKIGIIETAPGVVVGAERAQGFKDALSGDPNIEIVASLTGQTVDTAYKAAQDMLSAHPDLEGIYAANSNNAQGAARAVETAGKQDGFVLIGFNGDPIELEMVKAGKETATVAQDPYGQGQLAVKTAMELLEGKAPKYTDSEKRILRFPVQIVDSVNLEKYAAGLAARK
ncbi:substrate-binding domain-containing protein [Arthrobacter sp. GCM10027362]|uniref:substrate-binding domain-containing protein n=1 Tax=Arthrobacter sp. GCM10027362 TaxID=3273379 RepID=UPI0036347B66